MTPPARPWPTPCEALLDAGAHDAWITPVIMKKGRPGHTVSAPSSIRPWSSTVRQVLRAETGSLGVRATAQERWPATRTMDEVEVEGVVVRVKVSPGRVKVEQADAARVAARTGLPMREVVVPGRSRPGVDGSRTARSDPEPERRPGRGPAPGRPDPPDGRTPA